MARRYAIRVVAMAVVAIGLIAAVRYATPDSTVPVVDPPGAGREPTQNDARNRLTRSDLDRLMDDTGSDELTWDDLADFRHEDVGSGNYVYRYPMDDGSALYLSGPDLEEPPQSIYLIDGQGHRTDLDT